MWTWLYNICKLFINRNHLLHACPYEYFHLIMETLLCRFNIIFVSLFGNRFWSYNCFCYPFNYYLSNVTCKVRHRFPIFFRSWTSSKIIEIFWPLTTDNKFCSTNQMSVVKIWPFVFKEFFIIQFFFSLFWRNVPVA